MGPPVPVKKPKDSTTEAKEQADALKMPPPPVPGLRRQDTPMPTEATDSNSVAAPAGDEPMAIVPVVEETALARSDANSARQDGEQGDDAEEEEKSQLPEGFFDDPELDAKA